LKFGSSHLDSTVNVVMTACMHEIADWGQSEFIIFIVTAHLSQSYNY